MYAVVEMIVQYEARERNAALEQRGSGIFTWERRPASQEEQKGYLRTIAGILSGQPVYS